MANLVITIITENDVDYDNNVIEYHTLTGEIDGEKCNILFSANSGYSDQEMKDAFKTKLTEAGYTRDTES